MSNYQDLESPVAPAGEFDARPQDNGDRPPIVQGSKRKGAPLSEAEEGADFEAEAEVGVAPSKKQDTNLNKAATKTHKKAQTKVMENRAVYATNIPRDATFAEILETFKKAGIIEQGVDGTPRIKMYTDENGKFNGEILVVYFKKESIQQAIMRIDGWEFRLGDHSNGVVKVVEADPNFKKVTDGNEVKTKLVRQDRKAAERTRAELNRKLADWSTGDEEEVEKTFAPKKNKYAKNVIIKNAFQLDQINDEDDQGAVLEIKEDMREVAEKYGEVTKVVLYDKEPEGILTVRFKEFDHAEEFVKAFNGKRYNGENLQLSVATDRPRFKKAAKDEQEEIADNMRRMEKYMDGDKTDSGEDEV